MFRRAASFATPLVPAMPTSSVSMIAPASWLPRATFMAASCARLCPATATATATAAASATDTGAAETAAAAQKSRSSEKLKGLTAGGVPFSQRATPGPYRKVGNVFLVTCNDIPAKHPPQINMLLRQLRLEFKGQWVCVPDVPRIREMLFRVRHVTKFELVPLDELRAMLGVPGHVNFSDLARGLSRDNHRGGRAHNTYQRSHIQLRRLRRSRMRDILERDEVEVKLLKAKREQQQQQQQEEA